MNPEQKPTAEAVRVKTGIQLITEERTRQIEKEGWSAAHDDMHTVGDLIDAAICYGVVASAEVRGSCAEEWPAEMMTNPLTALAWPWEHEAWKPSDDPVRNLVKAGALIAAEIDRIQRSDDL
jgi:hypothetical protein